MHFSKSFGNFERQLPLKKGIGKFQRHLPLKLNQSPSKLGSLPVEVIGFSSQGQNAYRPLVSEACLRGFRVIFFNSADSIQQVAVLIYSATTDSTSLQ